jgi:ribosome-associated protein
LFAQKKTTQSTHKQTSVLISREPIRLGQFLKLANIVQDGLEAKIRIANGDVQVNGQKETQRGKKLVHGDSVKIDDLILQVTTMKE